MMNIEMALTIKDESVYSAFKQLYEKKKRPIGPTEVGILLDQKYTSASSYCTSSIKKLLAMNKLEQIEKGKYIPVQ